MEMMIIDGLSFAMPLFIMAVGGIFCERSGVTMLALEGLQGFGAFVGALTVVLLKPVIGEASPLMIYFAMAAAMMGGMMFSLLYAVLCVFFRAGQIISGVVVNILAVALTAFFTSVINKALTGDATNRFLTGVSTRFTVPGISEIPIIGHFFKNMYPYEIVILILAAFAWYVFYKTRFGLRLRACGDNPHSLDAAGGDVSATRVKAIMITGALSGLAGMCFAYSIMANFSPSIYMGYGYLSIAALIFGNWEILSTFAVCLFFGLARSGGYQLCLALGMSSNFSDLFLVLPYVLTLLSLVFFSRHNHPPRAIGEIFDKGKR
jgi:simple sugar transport system permease protein